MAKTRGPEANDFRISARTGFLDEGEVLGGTGAVRFQETLDGVVESIKADPTSLLTTKAAKKAFRIDDDNKIKPSEVISLILGSEELDDVKSKLKGTRDDIRNLYEKLAQEKEVIE